MTVVSTVSDERYYDARRVDTLVGVLRTRASSGTDSLMVKRPPRPFKWHNTVYNGKPLRFRVYDEYSEPPKRSRLRYNPYTITKNITRDTLAGMEGGYTVVAGAFGPWTAVNVNLFTPNDEINLINKIFEKIKGSSFNAAVTLGESREVLGMIGETATKLAKSIRRLKRGDISGSMSALLEGTSRKPIAVPRKSVKDISIDTMSSYWLQLQYGWLPLLKDVKAGAEFIAHHVSVPLKTTYISSIYSRVQSTNPAQNYWDPSVLLVDIHRRRIRAVISEQPSSMQKLGLLDPSIVAWELLPYSFVIDWFLPIGNWLEARAASSALTGTFYRCDQKSRDRYYLDNGFNPNTGIIYPFYGRNPESHSMTSNRYLETTLRVPLPVFKPLSKALSVQHCLNSIALLANLR